MLRIRDVYPGSRIRLFSIPDPNCLHPGSRILIKECKYFNPQKAKKWFLSSKKYDPGCSSRIPDPDADFLPSRIPDPGVKKVPNPGSRIRIRNTERNLEKNYFIGILKVTDKKSRIRKSVVRIRGFGSGYVPLTYGSKTMPPTVLYR